MIQLIVGAIVAFAAIDFFGSKARKPTKTTETWREGNDEINKVTFHDTGKTVIYRNGRRES